MTVRAGKRKPPVRVLVFGAFDFFHPGHRNFFKQAKKLGTELIVAVGRDHVVRSIKGQKPHHHEDHRLARVAAEAIVDRAVLAPRDPRRRYTFIKKLRPQVIGLGHDQAHYTDNLERELHRRGIFTQVIRLHPFRRSRYRSSLLRKKLR